MKDKHKVIGLINNRSSYEKKFNSCWTGEDSCPVLIRNPQKINTRFYKKPLPKTENWFGLIESFTWDFVPINPPDKLIINSDRLLESIDAAAGYWGEPPKIKAPHLGIVLNKVNRTYENWPDMYEQMILLYFYRKRCWVGVKDAANELNISIKHFRKLISPLILDKQLAIKEIKGKHGRKKILRFRWGLKEAFRRNAKNAYKLMMQSYKLKQRALLLGYVYLAYYGCFNPSWQLLEKMTRLKDGRWRAIRKHIKFLEKTNWICSFYISDLPNMKPHHHNFSLWFSGLIAPLKVYAFKSNNKIRIVRFKNWPKLLKSKKLTSEEKFLLVHLLIKQNYLRGEPARKRYNYYRRKVDVASLLSNEARHIIFMLLCLKRMIKTTGKIYIRSSLYQIRKNLEMLFKAKRGEIKLSNRLEDRISLALACCFTYTPIRNATLIKQLFHYPEIEIPQRYWSYEDELNYFFARTIQLVRLAVIKAASPALSNVDSFFAQHPYLENYHSPLLNSFCIIEGIPEWLWRFDFNLYLPQYLSDLLYSIRIILWTLWREPQPYTGNVLSSATQLFKNWLNRRKIRLD